MQPRYLVFVCHNERAPDDPRGSCTARGAVAVLERFKSVRARRKLKELFRPTKSGCMGGCAHGPTVVVARTGAPGDAAAHDVTCYSGVAPDDAEAIVDRHLVGGEPIERLISDPEWLE